MSKQRNNPQPPRRPDDQRDDKPNQLPPGQQPPQLRSGQTMNQPPQRGQQLPPGQQPAGQLRSGQTMNQPPQRGQQLPPGQQPPQLRSGQTMNQPPQRGQQLPPGQQPPQLRSGQTMNQPPQDTYRTSPQFTGRSAPQNTQNSAAYRAPTLNNNPVDPQRASPYAQRTVSYGAPNAPAHPQRPAPTAIPNPVGSGYTQGQVGYSQPYAEPAPQTMSPSASNRTLWWWVGGAGALGVLAIIGLVGLLVLSSLAVPRVPSGVSVDGVGIGGETLEAAAATLQQSFDARTLTVSDGVREYNVPLTQFGITIDTDATLGDLSDIDENAQLAPVYTVDLSQAQRGLVELSQDVNIDAVPGNPPQLGQAIEIPVVLDRLRVDVNGEVRDGFLELSMIEVEAPYDPTAPYTGVTVTHVVQPEEELGLIAKRYGVEINDIVAINDIPNADFVYVGQTLIIPAPGAYQPTAADAPAPSTNVGKAIVVSVGKQRVYAYENGQLIRSHLTSTGLASTPTVLGDYNIYVKYAKTDMSGPDYFLPDVPYTMYFYQGYGLHGTYWHNKFGRPMSHGCVNLPISEAEWFFNWAEVGTPVRVVAS